MVSKVREIIEDEGFKVNAKKGRVQRKSSRQTVTGIVVNDRPAVPRDEIRRLRAILHGAKFTGLAAQNRENLPHFDSWIEGKIAYVSMVDRTKGEKLLSALRLVRELRAK